MTIQIKELDEQQFLGIEKDWQNLLGASNCNSLFLSWMWQYQWWRLWGKQINARLLLLAMYDDGVLVGLAPMFSRNISLGPIKIFKRIQFIGNVWRFIDTIRTEYSNFITLSSRSEELEKEFFSYINSNVVWDEWIINDMDGDSSGYENLKTFSANIKLKHKVINEDMGMNIDCQNSFNAYLTSLSKSTRFRIYNSRKKLLKFGSITIETINTPGRLNFAFEQLNLLHRVRWGENCFDGKALEFHKKLSLDLLKNDQLKFSLILLDGIVISTLYNVIANQCEYNIQAGFDDKKLKGVSIGTLHLGYAIERAFSDEKCNAFDLLAGPGMNSDYKKKFKGHRSLFSTIQFVRNPALKFLYYFYRVIPSKIRYWLYRKKGFG
jgi:hypothetical protein